MKRIFDEGNYVVVDFDNNSEPLAFPKPTTVGERKTSYITLSSSHPDISENILITEINAGEWFQEDGTTAWDRNTLLAWLRLNTSNFNTASGGSGASPTKAFLGYVTQVGLNAPTIVPIFDNFVEPPTLAYSGVGSYVVSTNVADNPQIIKMTRQEFTSNTTAKSLKMFIQNFGSPSVPIFALISLEEDTSGGDFGKYVSKDDLLDGVNSIIELYEYPIIP